MCQPKDKGGQRCASHTRAELQAARARLATDPTAYEAVIEAEAQHAATPAGHKEIEAELAAAESPITKLDLEAALRRGDEIRERNAAVKDAMQTWTFVGHWEGHEIEVEYVLDGEVQDGREDDGGWPEGLWSAAGSGPSQETAEAITVAGYEAEAQGMVVATDPDLAFDLDAPDDEGNGPADMPIFSGTSREVGERLVPGAYRGLSYDGEPVLVVVGSSEDVTVYKPGCAVMGCTKPGCDGSCVVAADGTSGQDRESYSDDQDRDDYTA